MKCSYNGCELTNEEMESPNKVDEDIFCDECYDSWFSENSFECPLCQERNLRDEESDYFILFDAEIGEPGVYKVLSYPFCSQPLLGTPMLYDSSVSRIGFVPQNTYLEFEYSCAFVCKDCMTKKINQAIPDLVRK